MHMHNILLLGVGTDFWPIHFPVKFQIRLSLVREIDICKKTTRSTIQFSDLHFPVILFHIRLSLIKAGRLIFAKRLSRLPYRFLIYNFLSYFTFDSSLLAKGGWYSCNKTTIQIFDLQFPVIFQIRLSLVRKIDICKKTLSYRFLIYTFLSYFRFVSLW